MHREGIADHHYHHGNVESAKGAEDEEGLVVDGTHVVSWHDVGGVNDAQHRDDRGDQHRQQPHQHHLHAHSLQQDTRLVTPQHHQGRHDSNKCVFLKHNKVLTSFQSILLYNIH